MTPVSLSLGPMKRIRRPRPVMMEFIKESVITARWGFVIVIITARVYKHEDH